MDPLRFDQLVRVCGRTSSRRSLMKLAAASIGGAVATRFGARRVAAQESAAIASPVATAEPIEQQVEEASGGQLHALLEQARQDPAYQRLAAYLGTEHYLAEHAPRGLIRRRGETIARSIVWSEFRHPRRRGETAWLAHAVTIEDGPAAYIVVAIDSLPVYGLMVDDDALRQVIPSDPRTAGQPDSTAQTGAGVRAMPETAGPSAAMHHQSAEQSAACKDCMDTCGRVLGYGSAGLGLLCNGPTLARVVCVVGFGVTGVEGPGARCPDVCDLKCCATGIICPGTPMAPIGWCRRPDQCCAGEVRCGADCCPCPAERICLTTAVSAQGPSGPAQEQICCAEGSSCVGTDTCCPNERVCTDYIDPFGGPTNATVCCFDGTTCVNGFCCAEGGTITCGGSTCCAHFEACVGGACCPTSRETCNDACCQEFEVCHSGQCCHVASACPDGSCCAANEICLPAGGCGPLCPAERQCPGECCPEGETCRNGDVCCPSDGCRPGCCDGAEQCIDGECCPPLRACDSACCPEGEGCIWNEGTCCPEHLICQKAGSLELTCVSEDLLCAGFCCVPEYPICCGALGFCCALGNQCDPRGCVSYGPVGQRGDDPIIAAGSPVGRLFGGSRHQA